MSVSGLGRVKTPAPAEHVEASRSNCISESQIILHTRRSMPCWRIVFSTFRGCMSFYTARVIRNRPIRHRPSRHVRFSNRPIKVKRFQTIRRHGVDVARGFALLFGLGTKALPSWDSKTRWNNLCHGLCRQATVGQADIRTHLVHRPARDIIPPLGGSQVFSYLI
jgi:hypothetical protein